MPNPEINFDDILKTPAARFADAESEKKIKAETKVVEEKEVKFEEALEEEVEVQEDDSSKEEEEVLKDEGTEDIEDIKDITENENEDEIEDKDESLVDFYKTQVTELQDALKSGGMFEDSLENETDEKLKTKESETSTPTIANGVMEFATEDVFAAIQDGDRHKFNEVLTIAINSASQAVRETLLKDFNPLVKPIVQKQMQVERVWTNFYKQYPKLEEYHTFVISAAQKLVIQKKKAGEKVAFSTVLSEVASKLNKLVEVPPSGKNKKTKLKSTKARKSGPLPTRAIQSSGKTTQAEKQREILDYNKNRRLMK